ncbi:hypothetical protein [Glutamicibacter sp. TV12E]|uniref:hypothetical protein n=1 Tax=Glutamicibacter sp. TV12E TaxID=3446362 RepID=UPI004033E02E
MRHHGKPLFVSVLGFGTVVLLVISGLGLSIAASFHEVSKTCTVTGKESVAQGEEGHEYRVYTEQCGTLAVRDDWIRGRFNAADAYGQLQQGRTYDLVTLGWRIPIWSIMPNIYKASEVSP